jgi:hypothetical protein
LAEDYQKYKFIDRLSRSAAEYEERSGKLEEALKELGGAGATRS